MTESTNDNPSGLLVGFMPGYPEEPASGHNGFDLFTKTAIALLQHMEFYHELGADPAVLRPRITINHDAPPNAVQHAMLPMAPGFVVLFGGQGDPANHDIILAMHTLQRASLEMTLYVTIFDWRDKSKDGYVAMDANCLSVAFNNPVNPDQSDEEGAFEIVKIFLTKAVQRYLTHEWVQVELDLPSTDFTHH